MKKIMFRELIQDAGGNGFWHYWGDNGNPRMEGSAESFMSTFKQDIDGKQIFEGDICSFTTYGLEKKRFDMIGVVEWDHEDTGFYFSCNGMWPCVKFWFAKNIKVIGNRIENPELMKKI